MSLHEDFVLEMTPEADLREVAVLPVCTRVPGSRPRGSESCHDEALALPLGDAPVARRVGSRATHTDQAVSALRLPTLEGHPSPRGRRPPLRAGGGTAAADTRTTWPVQALADIGQTEVRRVAWTLADLAGKPVPGSDEVAEALGMRLQRVAA